MMKSIEVMLDKDDYVTEKGELILCSEFVESLIYMKPPRIRVIVTDMYCNIPVTLDQGFWKFQEEPDEVWHLMYDATERFLRGMGKEIGVWVCAI
jgi:hypothetical protein